MTCPGFDQLLDYLDGRLGRTAAESIAAHLGLGCRACDADRSWYQQVTRVAASDDSIEPPPWVLKRALRLFNEPHARGAAAKAARLVASLVFDSLNRPALAGARSTGAESRQLLYQADGYSIDVQISATDQERARLTGQILRESDSSFESVAGLQIELMRDGGTVVSVAANERGEFAIPEVDFGSCDLRIDLNKGIIMIAEIPIAEC